MKNTILYNYNLNNVIITTYKDKALVKKDNDIFLFQKIDNPKEVMWQYNVTKNNKNYFQFILNRDNSLFTKYKDNIYVLLKLKDCNNFKESILKPVKVQTEEEVKDWSTLWMEKCDFIEYQLLHINGKYKIIDESIDYYIGLIEVAIAYLRYNEKNKDSNKYLAHKRVEENNFYNPLNIKLDAKERDIAGYLKWLFLKEDYSEEEVRIFLNQLNLDKDSRIRLFARMLYPSHYLDLYDRLINDEDNEEKIKKVVRRTTEYEYYLKIIFDILNKNKDLPYLHFL